MDVKSYSTHVITPGENILDILDRYIPSLEERSVLAITSKIISVCEQRTVPKEAAAKADLIRQEADAFLESELSHPLPLTLKNGFLIPASGIDESNSDWGYILYPEKVQATTIRIWEHLRAKHQIQELGIIITDSAITPLRRGVTGVAIGWCGFVPFYTYIGKNDLFGRPLAVTLSNVLDALATAAVFMMGEGAEQTPIAVIKNAPKITFLDRPPSKEEIQFLTIPMEEDLYGPFLKAADWKTLS